MYLLTQSLQNGSDIRNVFPLCKVGYFKLYAMKVHPDNSFHLCWHYIRNTFSMRLLKRKLYNFLPLC